MSCAALKLPCIPSNIIPPIVDFNEPWSPSSYGGMLEKNLDSLLTRPLLAYRVIALFIIILLDNLLLNY